MANHKEQTMTKGNIWKQIIWFSVPLLIGNLFQQLYNTTDSVIVGNFVGKEALAAVGSSGNLINLIIGFFIGMTSGAGVVIAQYYGGGRLDKMKISIHTSLWFCTIGGAVMTVAGVALTPWILRLMGTPPEVLPNSVTYLRIYFFGSIFNIIYNMGAGILRSIGDSRRPLYYLIISSLVNIVLDVVLVVVFRMGVAGVGIATVFAQFVSCFCVMFTLVRSKESYHVNLKEVRCDRQMLKRILHMGIPSGLQSTIVSLSNVVVQSNINSFGADAMAGYGVYAKVDNFTMIPITSLALAATTFTGQNYGAKQAKRIRKGVRECVILGVSYALFIGVVNFTFIGVFARLFTRDAEVLRYATIIARIMALPGYVALVANQLYLGVVRGMGDTVKPMIISITSLCFIRMLWISLTVPLTRDIRFVFIGYPLTWAIAAVAEAFIYYRKSRHNFYLDESI